MLLALTYLTRHYAKRVDKLLERMDFNKRYTEACVCACEYETAEDSM